jgi:hypothetical protein
MKPGGDTDHDDREGGGVVDRGEVADDEGGAKSTPTPTLGILRVVTGTGTVDEVLSRIIECIDDVRRLGQPAR